MPSFVCASAGAHVALRWVWSWIRSNLDGKGSGSCQAVAESIISPGSLGLVSRSSAFGTDDSFGGSGALLEHKPVRRLSSAAHWRWSSEGQAKTGAEAEDPNTTRDRRGCACRDSGSCGSKSTEIDSFVVCAAPLSHLTVWRSTVQSPVTSPLVPGRVFFPEVRRGLPIRWGRECKLMASPGPIRSRCVPACPPASLPLELLADSQMQDPAISPPSTLSDRHDVRSSAL